MCIRDRYKALLATYNICAEEVKGEVNGKPYQGIVYSTANDLSLIHIYFQKVELADRQPLYVSRTTHEKLMRIVTVIGGRKVTAVSYTHLMDYIFTPISADKVVLESSLSFAMAIQKMYSPARQIGRAHV